MANRKGEGGREKKKKREKKGKKRGEKEREKREDLNLMTTNYFCTQKYDSVVASMIPDM